MNNKKYWELPFTYTITWSDDELQHWTVRVKELEGCMTHGKTPLEALANIPEAIDSYVKASLKIGDNLEKINNILTKFN